MIKFQIIHPTKIHAAMIIPEIAPPPFGPFSLILIVLNNLIFSV
jgi:hypothetical protein